MAPLCRAALLFWDRSSRPAWPMTRLHLCRHSLLYMDAPRMGILHMFAALVEPGVVRVDRDWRFVQRWQPVPLGFPPGSACLLLYIFVWWSTWCKKGVINVYAAEL